MAEYEYRLNAIKSAYCDREGQNDHNSAINTLTTEYNEYGEVVENAFILGFDAANIKQNLSGKIITSAYLYLYVRNATTGWYDDGEGGTSSIYMGATDKSFILNGSGWDENTVTWSDLGYVGNFPASSVVYTEQENAYRPIKLHDITIGTDVERYAAATLVGIHIRKYYNDTATIETTRGSNSPYIVVKAKDSVPVSTPISPSNVYKNNAAEIRLQWEYSNPSGGSQNGFQIQYKDALNTEWTELAQSVASAKTYYDVPANTFITGTVQWRVKVTSIWDVESEWSTTAIFEALGAPIAPGVSATNSPRPNITWVAEDQQAYEIKIDAEPSAFFFGGNKEYKAKKYYPDGPLTISVKTQNSYGLWSEWGETSVDIVNIPGAEINLAAQGNVLEWNLTEHTAYYVYRDGVPIAKTTQTQYEDLSATGKHIYRVRGVSGDNYSLSNEITLNVVVSAPQIADINNISKWVELKYSTSQDRTLSIFVRQDVIYQYYAGRQYPVAEMSPQTTKTFSFNVAFKTTEEAREFEALLGKTVVYKDQHGRRIVGPLVGYETNVSGFFNSYTCSIQQTDVIEAVEYD